MVGDARAGRTESCTAAVSARVLVIVGGGAWFCCEGRRGEASGAVAVLTRPSRAVVASAGEEDEADGSCVEVEALGNSALAVVAAGAGVEGLALAVLGFLGLVDGCVLAGGVCCTGVWVVSRDER